jgi:TRAP-type C4-dicarboxylate transport system permease small subunit
MRALERIVDRLGDAMMVIAGAAVVVAIMHITVDVALRYLFRQSLPGTIAIVINYYMPMMAFLPLAFTQRTDGHIVVDLFVSILPQAVQRHIVGWVFLLSAMLCTLLTWTTWGEAVNKFQRGTFSFEDGTVIATWPGQFLPTIGYGLLTLMLVLQFLRYLTGRDRDLPPKNTADHVEGGAA